MSIRQFVPPKSLASMRESGRSMKEGAMFEIDFSNGAFTWANEYALGKLGLELSQLQAMTAFDIVPSEFHDQVRDDLSDKSSGRLKKFSIWPSKTGSGKLAWWFVHHTRMEYPVGWSSADFIQETEPRGAAFMFMRITMANANEYGALHARVFELDQWVHSEIDRLNSKDSEFGDALRELGEKMKPAIAAAASAAATSKETAAAMKDLRTVIGERFDKHEEEILKLIGTDVYHDRRMEAFERHVKATTDVAIKSITTQADKAGRGLSRRVTIPVSAIATIATLIQWLINHFLTRN